MAISEKNMSLLLKSLKETVAGNKSTLENSADTWSRIGRGDSFADLGFESEEALKEWINLNPYANI